MQREPVSEQVGEVFTVHCLHDTASKQGHCILFMQHAAAQLQR
jgi:hypothetical protein